VLSGPVGVGCFNDSLGRLAVGFMQNLALLPVNALDRLGQICPHALIKPGHVSEILIPLSRSPPPLPYRLSVICNFSHHQAFSASCNLQLTTLYPLPAVLLPLSRSGIIRGHQRRSEVSNFSLSHSIPKPTALGSPSITPPFLTLYTG